VWCFALTVLHVWYGEIFWVPIVGETYEWTEEKIDRVLSFTLEMPIEIRDLLREMLSLDPSRRPSMRRVRDVFRKYSEDDVEQKNVEYDTTLDVLRASQVLSSHENQKTWEVLRDVYVLLQNAYNKHGANGDLKALCVYELARVHEALWRHLGASESKCNSNSNNNNEAFDSCFFAKASLNANKILSRSIDRFGWIEDFESKVLMFETWLTRCDC
jgi:serine/threonine protein kinase